MNKLLRFLQADELEHEADVLERAAPNRFRQSIKERRDRARRLRDEQPCLK